MKPPRVAAIPAMTVAAALAIYVAESALEWLARMVWRWWT